MENEFTLKKLFIIIAVMILLLVAVAFGISDLVKDLTATNISIDKNDIKEAAVTYSSEVDDSLWKETDEYDVFCVSVGELVNRDLLEGDASFDDDLGKTDFVMVRRNKTSFEVEDILITEKDDKYYKMCKDMLPEVKYTTTFYRNNASKIGDGTSDVITKECTAYGNESCVIVSPSIESSIGYSALGWNVNADDSDSIYGVGTEMLIDSNENYYAIVKANTVTIKYNVSGGNISYTSNSTGNWSKTSEGIVLLNGAVFTTSVSYGSSLGTNGLEDYNNVNRMHLNKIGYSATSSLEWICLSGCTGTYSQNKNYRAEDFCNSVMDNCEVVLGVNWKQDNYTIEYKANGGSGAPNSQSKAVGEYIYVSDSLPIRTGYTFKNWNTKADGSGVTYNPGSFYNEDKNLTLYAQWIKETASTYKVIYKVNGGSGEPSSQTKIEDIDLILSIVKPTRDGYTFKGWNTKVDGTGTNYGTGSTYKNNEDLTLYAQWTKNNVVTYSISYIGNGGSGAPGSQTKEYGGSVYISDVVPTRSGYAFKGWNTEVDGSGTWYNPGSLYSSNKSVVLYAQWSIIPSSVTYTITYNANGGSGAPDSQIKTKDIPIYLSSITPTKKNYTFVGWSTSLNGTGIIYNPGQYYNGNMNLKLYAKWKPNTENTVTSHTHNINAVGNTLRNIEKTKLSCGHYHTTALYKYCSVCGRSVYLIDSDEMYACPCSSYTTVFNDSVVGGFATYKSWLGGVVSGYYSLEKASTMAKDCSEH